jgi:rRNA maturation endonuclease Nob1
MTVSESILGMLADEWADTFDPTSLVGIALTEIAAMLDVPTLNKRKCHACGKEAWHAASKTPYVLCRRCGSQDTRLIHV